ncbi:YbaB/EbfC family nucleoid-associated protein [Actinophytocola algeriensis]|uniref:Uncharacterized protein n=1 Tax=Actinophytocola algeriensis TaxID=1768010 RepID=A0A7W7QCU7_9PSEU|nr:YbaB/EbfC family nucleoid-associated protein [Actinophytocola algeriensis]MBB4911163.1 hypothetical protein [Actinophytocola algeriensis]MBE1479102.1 hypothetical protein [Actinophytocola algeriensis]
MPDAIHSSLADVQSSLTAPHSAESPDGTVRAEATARRQTALHLSANALKLSPDTLATLILTTQQAAQNKAEAALTDHLETFRTDPRVATALDTLRDTQANPTPRTTPQTHRTDRADDSDDDNFVDSVYNSDRTW